MCRSIHDRLPFDELHREVRPSVRRAAAVEQSGDIRMLEAGEDLPLVPEAADDAVGVHAALEHLDRHALLERIIVANAKIDGSHAAMAELRNEAVRPKAVLTAVEWHLAGAGGSIVVGECHYEQNIPAACAAKRRSVEGQLACRGGNPGDGQGETGVTIRRIPDSEDERCLP